MCQTNFKHSKNFIYLCIKEIEKKISHKPEKVGEFLLTLPPRLWTIENKTPKEVQLIYNGLGQMMMFLVRKYEKIFPDNSEMYNLLQTLFEKDMTPNHAASIIIQITEAIIHYLEFSSRDKKNIFILPRPTRRDLGSKKIYYKAIAMNISLFIEIVIGNQRYIKNFKEAEKNWKSFVALAILEKNHSDAIH